MPTNIEVTIHRGRILHPDKTPPYISLLPKMHEMKTFHLYKNNRQIENITGSNREYTYRSSNQTITNCHTFKERSKK